MSVLDNVRDRKVTLILTLICVGLLLSILGIREIGVGKDDLQYLRIFHDIPSLDSFFDVGLGFNAKNIEFGFVYLVSFIKFFSQEPNFIFSVIGAISIIVLTNVYFRTSPLVLLSLLIFFTHFYLYRDLNQIRAALSCAILLNLLLVSEKKEIYCFLIIILASIFHIASLVMLLLIFARKIHWTNTRVLKILVISIFFGASGIVELLVSMVPGEGAYIFTKLSNYASSEMYGANLSLLDITNIKNVSLLLLAMFYRDRLSKLKAFDTVFLLMAINTCWRFFFSDVIIIAARGATFFAIIEPILIAMIVSVQKRYITLSYALVFLYSFLTLYLNINVKHIITNYNQILM